jgi:hypothetical protein
MTEPIEQLIDSASSIRMTDGERAGIRRTLEAYTSVYRPSVSAWKFLGRHAFASALMVLVLIAGGTTAVAHRATPDDVLYGVRLAVNDRIETLIAGDEDAQMDVELRQLQRMLDDEEFALDDELAALADGIEEEDEAGDAGGGDETDVDSGTSEDNEAESSRFRPQTPIRYDDGADVELNSIMRDLETAAQETPDMGE